MRLVPALALVVSGCFFGGDEVEPACGDGTVDADEACDDGNDVSDDGCSACVVDLVPRTLRVAWSLRDVASTAPTGCPAGYDTAEVITQDVTSDGAPIGEARRHVLACDRGEGTIVFDAGQVAEVRVTVRITNGTGGTLYAESLPATVDLSAGDGEVTVAILNDGGYFKLGWLLRGQVSGNELTCATVEPDVIRVVSTLAASMKLDQLTCADGEGLTGALVAGSYSVSVEARANDNPLGPAASLTNKIVLDKNRITDLGVVELPIAGL